MFKYIVRRLVYAVPTLIAVTFAAFMMVHLVPGNPARIELGPNATERSIRALQHTEGLDKPLWTQFWLFMRGCVTGKFGNSLAYHVSVASLIPSRVVVTALLVFSGLLVALLIAIPAAIVAALKQNELIDSVIRAMGMLFYLMPLFWLGLLLSYGFGLEAHLLPTSGYGQGLGGALESLVLPAVTLGLVVAPLFLRTLRSSIIETLDSEFVEAVRARGIPRRQVMVHHVLRNSTLPTITVVGLVLGFLVSGSVIIENVFNLPGLGALFVASVIARDFPVIQALTVCFGAAVVLVNVLTDVAYAMADPRVRL